MAKVCVFGAGAIGGYIAGHLARAGLCEVSVVARGRTLAALREDGLKVKTPDGNFTARPRATDNPAELGRQDYVLLTLKTHQLETALPHIAPLIDNDTAILPPTTGLPAAFLHGLAGPFGDRSLDLVDPTGMQMQFMPADQVLGIVYWIGAHTEAPAIVSRDGARASCMVGELSGATSERASILGTLLSNSGIHTPVRSAIRSDIWIKFVNSLCWNPVAVLTQATVGAIGALPQSLDTLRRMMDEADAVAAKLGIAVPVAPEKRIAVTMSAPTHKMSMLQDFEQGRPLELATLESSIQSVKAMADVPTPTIDAVLALAMLRAETARQEELKTQ